MHCPRLYWPAPLAVNQTLTLSGTQSHHLCRVLRLKDGASLHLFHHDNLEFTATLIETHIKHARILIIKQESTQLESPLSIHLGQCISQKNRMEIAIAKAVELGVSAITPIISNKCKSNTLYNQSKQAHWQQIIVSAAQQCGRCQLPILHPPTDYDTWLTQTEPGFICLPTKPTTQQDPSKLTQLNLLIGPEGGFQDQEAQAALTKNWQPLSLGPRILRTETATITAITLCQVRWGDLSLPNHPE